MTFEQTIQTQPLMLMEAAIIERLRHAHADLLHTRLAIAPLVNTPEGRKVLTALYREYIAIAKEAGLPIILTTPTWRANRQRINEENIGADLNADAAQFMQGFKQEHSNLFIGGQVGCKNDCYNPDEALSSDEAESFHRWQIDRLVGVDFLYGVTLPEINEALGMARAMAATEQPYIISFVIGKDGRMLNGTSLNKAIERIDQHTSRPPVGYGVNCCYPSFLQAATPKKHTAERLVSIQANASSLSHAELEKSDSVETDPIEDWCARMIDISRKLNVNILGGCCGTTDAHLRSIAATAPISTTSQSRPRRSPSMPTSSPPPR